MTQNLLDLTHSVLAEYPHYVLSSVKPTRRRSGYLAIIARCFYNRAMQMWGSTSNSHLPAPLASSNPNQNRSSTSLTSMAVTPATPSVPAFRIECLSHLDETRGDPLHAEHHHEGGGAGNGSTCGSNISSNALGNRVIDKQAYRVPFPKYSGGRFNSQGVIVCFGLGRLELSDVKADAAQHSNDDELTRIDLHRMESSFSLQASSPVQTAVAQSLLSLPLPSSTNAHALPAVQTNTQPPTANTRTYADMLISLREEYFLSTSHHSLSSSRPQSLAKSSLQEFPYSASGLFPGTVTASSSSNVLSLNRKDSNYSIANVSNHSRMSSGGGSVGLGSGYNSGILLNRPKSTGEQCRTSAITPLVQL